MRSSAHCRDLVGSIRIPGIAGGIDVISQRWAEAGNLDNNGFVPGFGKMTLAWWFCVIASRRKRLEFRLVEAISVSDAPRTGNHSCDAIVAMGMGCDPGMRGHAKHNRVYPSLIRIAFQDHRLDACNSGVSRTRIASLRVLILCRRQALFRRSVEKSTDQRYCLNRAFLHQPVSGACNHRFSNIGCYVTHNHGLQSAERLLSAHSKHRHGELLLLEDSIIFRILRERGKLREPSSHSSWLCVGCCEEVSGCFVRFFRIGGEVIPDSVEVNAFAALP